MRLFGLSIPIVAMIVATMLPSTVSADIVANLLTNAGFETPAFTGEEQAGPGDGWTAFGDVFRIQGAPISVGAFEGTVAMKVFGVSGVFQDFAASEGQTWDGGAWILNNSLDPLANGQVAAVNIEWLDASGGQISFLSNGNTTASAAQDQWTQQTVSGVAPAGTATARFVLITGDFLPGGAGGAPVYDDAFFGIRAIPEPASATLLGLGAIGMFVRRRRS